MARIIRRVDTPKPLATEIKRVAAYARVSSGKDAMLHSLSAQVSQYNELIQSEEGWVFVGVYADEALTGTREHRPEFQRMLEDCRQGKIDMVITKSISRFARNTVTLLKTVRELKQIGVDVFFEEQNIHTSSSDGELMLTILASYSQEESRSVSENQRWRVKKNFEEGKPWNGTVIGYRIQDGKYVVVPEEAAVVRRMFEEYLAGDGYTLIANRLVRDGIPTRQNGLWTHSSVHRVLHNYSYTGNLLLQTTFCQDYLTKHRCANRGEKPMYHVVDAHEPIVSLEMFEAVQREADRRSEQYGYGRQKQKNRYPFTGKLKCVGCGAGYRRKRNSHRTVWICGTFNTRGKAYCPTSKQIPEDALEAVAADVFGMDYFDEHIFQSLVKQILVDKDNVLHFILRDDRQISVTWKDRSRAESWTKEMKAKARDDANSRPSPQRDAKGHYISFERSGENGIGNSDTGNPT